MNTILFFSAFFEGKEMSVFWYKLNSILKMDEFES